MINVKNNVKSVRGMHDYLPQEVAIWKYVENKFEAILNSYGYSEIRFPIIEFTDLFKRSIGKFTDIVEKEMYTFDDRDGNSLTLRPEGTSSCVRVGIEHQLFYHKEPRFWYSGPMFRRERPQKGRYRQFHQFSAEAFGQYGPEIDVELILIATSFWKVLGISECVFLELNSIGSLESRMSYRQELINFLEKKINFLDKNSIRRLYSNPMRVLDTKDEKIKDLLRNAPVLSDYLDESSRSHFVQLCRLLDALGVLYSINPYLVRGLDYYNRTVFEWTTNSLGVKKTVCAGGRYDTLSAQLGGGVEVPAVGFSIGLERIILLMQTLGSNIISDRKVIYIDVCLACLECNIQDSLILLSEYIRLYLSNLRIVVNYKNYSFKRHIFWANKNNVKILLVIDSDYIYNKIIILKDLRSGDQKLIKYDNIIDQLQFLLCK